MLIVTAKNKIVGVFGGETIAIVGSPARVGATDGTCAPGIKVGSNKELMEFERMAECD